MKTSLPADFIARLSQFLPAEEHASFLEALAAPAPVSVQYHPQKGRAMLGQYPAIDWYALGAYLTERPVFTLDPAFHAGAYYVQEAGSMFIAYLAQQLLPADRPWRILDLCAAPGGKSCLLASVAPGGLDFPPKNIAPKENTAPAFSAKTSSSLLISNEIIKSRYQILRYNIAKWGMDNCWTSQLDPERFADLNGYFDLVLVDAPCSGEGLFRKDPKACEEWSLEATEFCGLRQERILRAAAPLVSSGGLLLYSTCTYNQRENETQAGLLEKLGFSIEQPEVPTDWGIASEGPGYRFFPHRLASEGFFALAARKIDDERPQRYPSRTLAHWTAVAKHLLPLLAPWIQAADAYHFYQDSNGLIYALHQDYAADAGILAAALGRIDLGFPVGHIKGKQLVPAPELAFHSALHPAVARVEVDKHTALRLLKCETPPIEFPSKGRFLITYQGLGLLWVNALGNRYNNNYPSAWRIRMHLPS